MNALIVPSKLREAREARGLSLDALGERVGQTRQTISKYENGRANPRSEIIHRLSEELDLPIRFFMSEPDSPDLAPIFFRSLRSTLVRHRTMGERKLGWLQHLVRTLQKSLVFPIPEFTDFNAPSDPRTIQDADIEAVATALRRSWGLGDGAIPNIVQLLESKGAIVVRNLLGLNTIDAFSQWSHADQRPFIVLGSDKDCAVSSRFSAAHELGHLILHRNVDKRFVTQSSLIHRRIENQAHLFASAFLLPAETFTTSVPRIDLDVLSLAKPQWGASIGTMIKRAATLKMISAERERALFILRSQRGWTKREPLDDVLPVETPQLLKISLNTLATADMLRLRNALTESTLAAADIAAFCSVPVREVESYLEPAKIRVDLRLSMNEV